jgi:hypothetical protein
MMRVKVGRDGSVREWVVREGSGVSGSTQAEWMRGRRRREERRGRRRRWSVCIVFWFVFAVVVVVGKEERGGGWLN